MKNLDKYLSLLDGNVDGLLLTSHEGLGNGGDHGIDLDVAVGVDVGQLGAVEAEDVDPLAVALDVAGNAARDDGPAILHGGGLSGDGRQIVDEVVRLMIGGMNGVGQDGLVHAQGHHNILFLVQIQFSKVAHRITLCFEMIVPLLYHRYGKWKR